MDRRTRLSPAAVAVVAAVLGLLVALADVWSPFGDDSAKSTILLWLVCSGVLGFARPERPWRWAFSMGPWLPLTHLVRHGFGVTGPVHPGTTSSFLLLLALSIAVCSGGAYTGAAARQIFGPTGPQ
jgi:hypothetical protein